MLAPLLAMAAFVVGDRYAPADEVAWLCPQPEVAAEIGRKTDEHVSLQLIGRLAEARGCVSWKDGAMNVREARRIDSREVGLIRVIYGSGPEISYWVARNTLRWAQPRKQPK